MDFTKASHAFQEYLKDYNQNNDKVRLKIVHTYGCLLYTSHDTLSYFFLCC